MAVMQFIGSEVIQDFTDDFAERAQNPLEERQTENLLKQLNNSLEDIDSEKSLGFDDFSFDVFKQQLIDVLNEKRKELQDMPNGIFSGFKIEKEDNLQAGMIVLLGVHPKREGKYKQLELIYLDNNGAVISDNIKVVLEILSQNRLKNRYGTEKIDAGDIETIEKLQNTLNVWVKNQNTKTIDTNENTIELAGNTQLDILQQLQKGSKKTIEAINDNEIVYNKKYDLITWMLIS
jgi:hypothetical protein